MLKLFKNLKKREWIMISISLLFIVFQVFLDLKLPDYMAEVTRLTQTPGSVMSDILIEGAKMMGIVLLSVTTAVVVGYFAARIASNFGAILREKIFKQVDSFSMEEINAFSTASLITRTTNDVNQVQMIITIGLQVMIKAPIMAVWALLKIYDKGLEWSYATLIALSIMIVTVVVAMVIAMPKFKKMQILIDDINAVSRENLSGLRVIRAYNAEDYQADKFEVVNENLVRTQLFTSRTMSIMMPFITLVMSGLTLAIYFIGAILINNADMMVKLNLFSNMVVFSSYAMQVIMAFMLLVMIFVLLPRASVSAKRILEVLDSEVKIKNGDVTTSSNEGVISFNNVSFKYPDASSYVLKDLNFDIKAGEKVAFIGSTGSGKSTIVNLIMRFFDTTEGSIILDDVNIKDYKLESLYEKIGYVPQKAVIFSDDVKSNVSYGNSDSISDDDIKSAIKIAQAEDFVLNMDETYDSMLARGGSNISGGQKQRLSIARAIAKDPEIYIFDDSFSALDYRTDKLLRDALEATNKNKTTLIVAQRIGTIMDADKIIVLDKGEIVGIGSHEYLLNNNHVYQEIARSQFDEEELFNE